jgi:hypothetical protein
METLLCPCFKVVYLNSENPRRLSSVTVCIKTFAALRLCLHTHRSAVCSAQILRDWAQLGCSTSLPEWATNGTSVQPVDPHALGHDSYTSIRGPQQPGKTVVNSPLVVQRRSRLCQLGSMKHAMQSS